MWLLLSQALTCKVIKIEVEHRLKWRRQKKKPLKEHKVTNHEQQVNVSSQDNSEFLLYFEKEVCVCLAEAINDFFFSNLEGFLLDITEKEIIFVKFVADPILYNSFL